MMQWMRGTSPRGSSPWTIPKVLYQACGLEGCTSARRPWIQGAITYTRCITGPAAVGCYALLAAVVMYLLRQQRCTWCSC